MRADWHAGDHPEQFGRTLRTRSAQAKAADRMLCKMPLFQNTENCVLPSVSVNLTVAAAVKKTPAILYLCRLSVRGQQPEQKYL